FSSRRRHTRSKRDWSSDVCSSDLIHNTLLEASLATAKASSKISSRVSPSFNLFLNSEVLFDNSSSESDDIFSSNPSIFSTILFRSEERRVGKECIFWLLSGHCQ